MNMICGCENQYMTSQGSGNGCSQCRSGMMILIGIISGLVFAAAVVLLFINSLITVVFPFVLAVLITGLAALLTILTASLALPCSSEGKKCIRCNLGGLFFGIIGTVISALLAISTDLAVGSVIAAVTLGLTAFFTAYLIVSILFVVMCSTEC